MSSSVSPFLMFQDGRAEEAMLFYTSVFPGGKIIELTRHTNTTGGSEGQIMLGIIEINAQRVRFTDSPPVHEFGFTPSMSLFVECASAQRFDTITTTLAEDGEFLMPPDNYGFSQKFAFFKDKFGVSWQTNLPN